MKENANEDGEKCRKEAVGEAEVSEKMAKVEGGRWE